MVGNLVLKRLKSLSLISKINNFNRTMILRKFSSKENNEEKLTNEPVKFFGSEAANWTARDSRSGGSDKFLWYQPYVISGSLAVFMFYFCYLREENDIDRKLEGNLFDHVEGLEEMQLSVNYKFNKEHGIDNTEIEKRLLELGIDVKQLELASSQ